jgi:hypothetical protein
LAKEKVKTIREETEREIDEAITFAKESLTLPLRIFMRMFTSHRRIPR